MGNHRGLRHFQESSPLVISRLDSRLDVGEDGYMSDDIERLLSEVSKTTGSTAKPGAAPARREQSQLPEQAASAGGRLAFAVVAAVVLGLAGFVVGIFVPFFLGGFSTAIGAAGGAFLTALAAGPPRWFSS
jgi:hypothetical protein